MINNTKVDEIVTLLLAGDPAWKTKYQDYFNCIWDKPEHKAIETLVSQANPGVLVGASMVEPDLVEPLIGGVAIGKIVSAYGAGTAYSLTNTQAAIDLGTTDPAIVIDEPGTYLIQGSFHLAYTGATVVAETAALKARRTNNTAADVSVLPVIDLPVATTLTHTNGIYHLPAFRYATPRSDDAISLFGAVSAALGAGTIDVVAIGTYILAQRIGDATT